MTSTMNQSISGFISLTTSQEEHPLAVAFLFFSFFSSFIHPLRSPGAIPPTGFIGSCGNGASLVIICHTCPLKRQQWTGKKNGFIISIKKKRPVLRGTAR